MAYKMTPEYQKILTEYKITDKQREWLAEFESMCTGQIIDCGYHRMLIRGHHRANSKGYVKSSILFAEKELGKPLPPKAVVHHADGNKLSFNLVICQDQSYHRLLHTRMNAYLKTGDAEKRPCAYCHEYDSLNNLVAKNNNIGNFHYHQSCSNNYNRKRNMEVKKLRESRNQKEPSTL